MYIIVLQKIKISGLGGFSVACLPVQYNVVYKVQVHIGHSFWLYWIAQSLELPKFKKISCQNFAYWSDCSTHDYCNLTKFGQDWTENKIFHQESYFYYVDKILAIFAPPSPPRR